MTIPQNLGNLGEFTGLKRGLWGIVTFTNYFVYWYVAVSMTTIDYGN